jgi:amidophosphoribosyltransferase
MKDKCGVFGIALDSKDAALPIYYGLYALQHRGQESAGIATHDSAVHIERGMGLVHEVFDEHRLARLQGSRGIGHVRYSTTGLSRLENCQPALVNYRGGAIAIAHNGDIVNSLDIRQALEAEGRIFVSDSDTEVIAHLLVKELMRYDTITAVQELMNKLRGSYSITLLINDAVIGIRDPYGIKPLCIGKFDDGYVLSSESAAIDTLGGTLIRDVYPGEIISLSPEGFVSHRAARKAVTAHCMFEYVYFARPDSILDGALIYEVRRKIGQTLAEGDVEADIVIPVPDSGIAFAVGYAEKSQLPYTEGLMKNRYVGRTFIMPGQDLRETAVRLKLNVIKKHIEGKRVVMIDDSIVRGTTSRKIVDMLRAAGAKEVHMRIGTPPIVSPCYLGIDMPTYGELIAARKSVDGVRLMIGVDSLRYITLAGLIDSIGLPREELCLGCLTGVYPIEKPAERAMQLKLDAFAIGAKKKSDRIAPSAVSSPSP